MYYSPSVEVERFFYPSNSKPFLLNDGLLSDSEVACRRMGFISFEDFANGQGAILVAEGGMGKSTVMRQLYTRFPAGQALLVKLKEYLNDSVELREEICQFINLNKESASPAIIFDGLDEAEELVGPLLRALKRIPGNYTIWIASRDTTSIRSLQNEMPQIKTYSLATLSECNIRDMAKSRGLDDNLFWNEVKSRGFTAICAKPLGCLLAMSVFGEDGFSDTNQQELWHKGIRCLCDEASLSVQAYTLDQVVECSAWIALILALSENEFIWRDEESRCPQLQCVSLSDIVTDKFPLPLVLKTISRGIFTSISDGRIQFSHAMYHDYLAAYGLIKFMPSRCWEQFLLTPKRDMVFPQRSGLAAWVACLNSDFREELFSIQPELLLISTEAVQAIGPKKLCEAFLNRVDQLSYSQRRNNLVYNNLFRLNSGEASRVVKNCLLKVNASESVLELAAHIVEACQFSELSDTLIDLVLDSTKPPRLRRNICNVIRSLENHESQIRLTNLLPIDPTDDSQDDLRGAVLDCLWPRHIQATDLVKHLTYPQQESLCGQYYIFLSKLPRSLATFIRDDSSEASDTLLAWAIDHLPDGHSQCPLKQLAQAIFTLCWKWSSSSVAIELLAKGYVKSHESYVPPFLEKDSYSYGFELPCLSSECFANDSQKRFRVLEVILGTPEIPDSTLFHMSYGHYPLYTEADIQFLFEYAKANSSSQSAQNWYACVENVLARVNLDDYAEQIDELHELQPCFMKSSKVIRDKFEDLARKSEESQLKWQAKREQRETQGRSQQCNVEEEIKLMLQDSQLCPELFVNIASWSFSENGRKLLGCIDLQESPIWPKLDVKEQERLINLAERYLKECDIESTAPEQFCYTTANALFLLRSQKPNVYEKLPEGVWRKCSVELLKLTFTDDMKYVSPLFNTLSDKFPQLAIESILQVLRQELERGCVSVIRSWGKRLTVDQANRILDFSQSNEFTIKQKYAVLAELAKHGFPGIVQAHLKELFSNNWANSPDSDLNQHLSLAFSLSPEEYALDIIQALDANHDWGRAWFEQALGKLDYCIENALLSCSLHFPTTWFFRLQVGVAILVVVGILDF